MRMKEHVAPPARETVVYLCEGAECSPKVKGCWDDIRAQLEPVEGVTVKTATCLSRCDTAPNICISDADPTAYRPRYFGRVGKRLFGTPVREVIVAVNLFRQHDGTR